MNGARQIQALIPECICMIVWMPSGVKTIKGNGFENLGSNSEQYSSNTQFGKQVQSRYLLQTVQSALAVRVSGRTNSGCCESCPSEMCRLMRQMISPALGPPRKLPDCTLLESISGRSQGAPRHYILCVTIRIYTNTYLHIYIHIYKHIHIYICMYSFTY